MRTKHTLPKLICKSKLYLQRHSSTILTVVGAVGVIATAAAAVRATPKAMKLVEQATDEKGEELTKKELFVVAAPAYIPSAAIGASTIICIFGANALNKRQQAAIASAYALADRAYKDYRGKVKELLGDETDNAIREANAKDKRDEDIVAYAPGVNTLAAKGEKMLFYEDYRSKYFEASMEEVLNAEYHLNRNFALRGYSNLNEFYEFLGLEKTDFGDILGWSAGDMIEGGLMPWIEFNHHMVTMDDGLECCIIETYSDPISRYDEY